MSHPAAGREMHCRYSVSGRTLPTTCKAPYKHAPFMQSCKHIQLLLCTHTRTHTHTHTHTTTHTHTHTHTQYTQLGAGCMCIISVCCPHPRLSEAYRTMNESVSLPRLKPKLPSNIAERRRKAKALQKARLGQTLPRL